MVDFMRALADSAVAGLPLDAVPAGLVLVEGPRPDRPAIRVGPDPFVFVRAVLADLDGVNPGRGLDFARHLARAVPRAHVVAPSPESPRRSWRAEAVAAETARILNLNAAGLFTRREADVEPTAAPHTPPST